MASNIFWALDATSCPVFLPCSVINSVMVSRDSNSCSLSSVFFKRSSASSFKWASLDSACSRAMIVALAACSLLDVLESSAVLESSTALESSAVSDMSGAAVSVAARPAPLVLRNKSSVSIRLSG